MAADVSDLGLDCWSSSIRFFRNLNCWKLLKSWKMISFFLTKYTHILLFVYF